jgi:hypothetical protein
MSKKLRLLFYCILFIALQLPVQLHAQAHINYSTYLGGSGQDSLMNSLVVNGETYILSNTTSANFPVTNGSSYSGGRDAVVTKLNVDGSVAYSTYIGGSGDDIYSQLQVIAGEVYIAGTTNSPNLPVTNGSTYSGGADIAVTKLNASGAVSFSTYYGGSGDESLVTSLSMQIIGNELYLLGSTTSTNFPVSGGTPYAGGTSDAFLIKLNSTNGATIFATCMGGNGNDAAVSYIIQSGNIYINGRTKSSNFPVTTGHAYLGSDDVFAVKMSTTGVIGYATYIGGTNQDNNTSFRVFNGEAYFSGITNSLDFPVTDGSSNLSGLCTYIVKLDANGNTGFSKLIATDSIAFDFSMGLEIDNGNVYLLERQEDPSNDFDNLNHVIKLNSTTGDIIYNTPIKGVRNNISNTENLIYDIEVSNGEVYLNGITRSPNFPATNGSSYTAGSPSGFFAKLDVNGTITYATYLGEMTNIGHIQIVNNKVYMIGITDLGNDAVTDASTYSGGIDNVLFVLNADGSTYYATYLGGSADETSLVGGTSATGFLSTLQISNNEIYVMGRTTSVNYPVSNTIPYKGNTDEFLTRIQFCPFTYDVTADTLSPATQTTCKQGVGSLITSKSIIMAQTDAPILYRNGNAQPQNNIEASYQWQTAASLAGPWTNITTGGATKNYLPTGGNATQYYRRLAYTLPGCGIPAIDTSDVATVAINSNLSPVVNAGGNFYTCPGTPVTIGGSPTVSGGTLPYTYNWDMGAGATANPVVSPAITTVYTLTVTDALGCRQLGQAIVGSYTANAGADKNNCAGTSVQIGTPALPGAVGVTYNWSPTTNLSDATMAQPFTNPTINTNYTLTVVVPVSGGGTCTTTDDVVVAPIAAPVTTDFAGPDQVICLGDSVSLGTPPEAGFTYTWAPSTYLQSNINSTATFFAGNVEMPYPNPGTIYLTAKKGTCSFVDQTVVAAVEARADIDYCGPRTIGLPDRTPDINETYLWTKAGPGNFIGPNNLPQVAVSASVGGTTDYTLSVTYNGHTCTDVVSVPECAGGCLTKIHADAKYGCPSYDLNGGNVTLTATCGLPNVAFTWSPAIGLSSTTGASVQLTDNVQRTYTVTATSIYDGTVFCSDSIQVNNPASAVPVFTAPNVTTCANVSVVIGAAPVAGYSYAWTGAGLSNNFISNPTANIASSTSYTVQVTDTTGCSISDVVNVQIEKIPDDGEPLNFSSCSNAIIKLGAPALPGVTYTWIPPASPWQNGTNQNSAQPEVLVAANQTFFRITQTASGCVKADGINVNVNNSPTIPDAPDTTICAGAGVKIGSPALPGVVYLWTPSTGLSDPTIAQPVAAPATNTTYTVLATFQGACTGPATDQVTVNVSDPSFTLPAINYCPSGGSVALGAAAPAGMASYNWSPANMVSNSTIANPTTLNPPPSVTSTYTLTVKNTTGCVASSGVTIIPGQSAPIAGTNAAICVNNLTVLGSASNATGPGITYQWSPATYLNNPNSIQPIFTGTDVGSFTYILTKTDANISCVSTATVTITVNGFNLPTLTSPVICQNSCKEIGTTPVAGAHYLWSPAAGLSDPTIANPVACVGTSGNTYSLTATGATGCTASAVVVVGVSASPAPQVTIPPVNVCLGANNVSFNPAIAPAGVYNYLWSPDDASLSNIYTATPDIFITASGSKQYTLTVTDPVSGCSNTATTSLVVTACSPLAQIGDYVWYDDNADGLQNINEAGVSGATVTVYNSVGSVLGTGVTDATGHYLLKNIQPGSGYYIIVKRPSGYNFTTQNVGGVAAINNSKVDPSGLTGSFAVASGDQLTLMDAGIVPIPTPLPISLVNFAGQLNNNEIVLNWQTSAEFDNNYFIVEKSIDGINYTKIGTVNGNGTTTIAHAYNFIDMQPAEGNNYYRLIQVDYDNSIAYSNVVVITAPSVQSMIATYLPAEHSIFISFNKLQKGTLWFNLYADNGQLISSTSAENIITNKINTTTLATGIYMLQVISSNNNYAKKIFINK